MIGELLLLASLAGTPAPRPEAPLRVVDDQRRPVAGARVRVWLLPVDLGDVLALVAPLCDITSDEEGSVACRFPTGLDVMVAVDAPTLAPLVIHSNGESLDNLRLPVGRTLAGSIVSPAGIPAESLRSARISATVGIEVPELRRTLSFARVGTVASDGKLLLPGLVEGNITVRLDVRGFLPWAARVSPHEALLPALTPGVLLRGTALDQAGDPVPGCEIDVDGVAEPPRAESDQEGRFEIAVAQVPVTLAFSASGYKTAMLLAPSADRELVAKLLPGQGVRGLLLDADRRPVSAAKLWYERTEVGGTQKDETELTIREGLFKADLPEPGDYTFRFEAVGHRPEPTAKLEVTAGEHLDLGTIVLHTGAGVSGTVVDESDGEPVRGALVVLIPQGVGIVEEVMYHRALRAVSGDEGAFSLTGATEGAYRLEIAAAGIGKAWLGVSLADDIVEQLGVVPLGPGVAVHGRVQTRGRQPLAGAGVRWFDSEAAGLSPLGESTSDHEGRFELRLPPGTYLVRVVRGRVLLAEQVELRTSTKEQVVDLVSPSVRLTGIVTRSGAPVSGGSLTLTDALDPASRRGKVILTFGPNQAPTGVAAGLPESIISAEVGPDGKFVVEDASVGSVRIGYVGADGTTSYREIVVPDQAEVAVVIDLDGLTLSGTVVDDRGVPIDEATVMLLSNAGTALRQVQTGLDGAFRFGDLQPGTYSVSGRARGYRTNVVQGIAVAADQLNQATLTLQPGTSGSLTVQLYRAGGGPAASVPLTLLDLSGRMVAALPTDSSGQILFSDLPAGDYVVAWSDPFAGAGASSAMRVNAEAHARFDRVLEPGVGVTLHCVLPTCQSLQVGAMQLLTPLGIDIAPLLPVLSTRLRLGADGWFRLGAVSPGWYTLQILVGATPYRRQVLLSSGEMTVELP